MQYMAKANKTVDIRDFSGICELVKSIKSDLFLFLNSPKR